MQASNRVASLKRRSFQIKKTMCFCVCQFDAADGTFGTWKEVAGSTIPTNQQFYHAQYPCLDYDGADTIWLAGGQHNWKNVVSYKISTKQWTFTHTPMATGYVSHGCKIISGRLHVVGGRDHLNRNNHLITVYDTTLKREVIEPNPMYVLKRYFRSKVSKLGRKLFVVGDGKYGEMVDVESKSSQLLPLMPDFLAGGSTWFIGSKLFVDAGRALIATIDTSFVVFWERIVIWVEWVLSKIIGFQKVWLPSFLSTDENYEQTFTFFTRISCQWHWEKQSLQKSEHLFNAIVIRTPSEGLVTESLEEENSQVKFNLNYN